MYFYCTCIPMHTYGFFKSKYRIVGVILILESNNQFMKHKSIINDKYFDLYTHTIIFTRSTLKG